MEINAPHGATVLAFACAIRSLPIPRAALLALIPEVDDPGHAIALMHHADVDPVALARELAEQGRLSNERLALALHAASLQLVSAPAPQWMLAELRQLARVGTPPSLLMVAAAAAELADSELSKLVLAPPPGMRERMREGTRCLSGDARERLPESEAPRLQSG